MTDSNHRDRLTAALAAVIAEHGYHGTRIHMIAREAGVSLRTFYAEFPNKEACFLELHAAVMRQLERLIIDSVDAEKPWYDQIEVCFRGYLEAMALWPQLTYALLVEVATLGDDARRARQLVFERFSSLMVQLTETRRRMHPEIPSRPLSPLMARGILGAITELAIDFAVRDELHRVPELAPVAADMMWSVITNVTPAPAARPETQPTPAKVVKTLRVESAPGVPRWTAHFYDEIAPGP